MAVARRASFRRPPKPGKRGFQLKEQLLEQLLRGGKCLGFDPIGHSVDHVPVCHAPLRNPLLNATNASSFALAAPLAIALRARSMPSSKDLATPAT